MKFWDDGHPDATRIRNVNFAYKKLLFKGVFLLFVYTLNSRCNNI